MQLENIVKKAAFVGAITVASAFPLFSDDAVTVDKDEETGIEYYYEDGDMVGYRDTDSPENEDVIWIEGSDEHENIGGSYYDKDPLLSLLKNTHHYSTQVINSNYSFRERNIENLSEKYEKINSYLERLEEGSSRYNQSVNGLLHLIEAYAVGYSREPLENETLNTDSAIDSVVGYADENVFESYFTQFMEAYAGAVDILYNKAQENSSEASSKYQKIIDSYEAMVSNVGEDTFLKSLEEDNELHEDLTLGILISYSNNGYTEVARGLYNLFEDYYDN
jgi:hypothetical protein